MRKKQKSEKKNLWLNPVLIAVALYAVMFAIMAGVVTPERYDIKIGHPAPVTIFATKDVEDIITTQKQRDEAASMVEYTYRSVDTSVTSAVAKDFSIAGQKTAALKDEYTREDIEEMTDDEITAIGNSVGVAFSKQNLLNLMDATPEDLSSALSTGGKLIRETLDSTLPEGQEAAALSKLSRDMNSESYSPALVAVVVDIARATIRPNMLIDEETTELNRQKARVTIEPQMRVKGEVVVREGDLVTESEYQILSSLGLITDSSMDLQLLLGIALINALVFIGLAMYIAFLTPELMRSPRKLLLLSLIIVMVMLFSVFVMKLNVYVMPVALGLMLVSTLIEPRLALFVNIMLGIVTSLFASASNGVLSAATFSITIMAALSGPMVVYILTRHAQRTSVLLAGVAVSCSNFLVTAAVGLMNSASASTAALNALWAAAGGMLSALLSIGIQPLMEWLFNLVTNAKLLELSNPNQPLLHRLLLEAPGTYHHSIIVANLADAAANAIGANALLARTAAYYHDVGKLRRPMYFKENQLGDNPHDRADPRVSTAILTAHTRDGAQLAQKAHLPQELIDVIRQHHGDSPVMFFYDKAKKLYGEDIDISAYRYEGPRPMGKETAVVMLADIIEAAARSMPSHDPQKIENLIHKLVHAKIDDGQLDNSDLTFQDLDKICNAFFTVLSGVFHERIEYPDVKLPPRQEQSVPAETANTANAPAAAENKE